jgi:hypothetical protein
MRVSNTAKIFTTGRSQAVRWPIEQLINALGEFASFPDREQPKQQQKRVMF